MNKIFIYYGSKKKFFKRCPKEYLNLTYLALESDRKAKKMELKIKGLPKELMSEVDGKEEDNDSRSYVENFVIDSNEYSGVNDHVIINFVNFLSDFRVDNLFLQNPPSHIREQLERVYGGKMIKIEYERYKAISTSHIKMINENYNKKVIGQEEVNRQLLKALFPLTMKKRRKPVVILFYGSSGVGKTETALFLADLLKEKIFRKQFSMFQNDQFSKYLFGSSHHEGSFAKDLLDRESNVILLDEFDKANPFFHSAFYQLFDEGVFVDTNYRVELDKAIIICTSNYETIGEIKEKLGAPIYNRFDVIIHFKDLSDDAKKQIGENIFKENSILYKNDYGFVLDKEIEKELFDAFRHCSNAREIKRLIDDVFALGQVEKILKS